MSTTRCKKKLLRVAVYGLPLYTSPCTRVLHLVTPVRFCGQVVTVLAWTVEEPEFESWFGHLSRTDPMLQD